VGDNGLSGGLFGVLAYQNPTVFPPTESRGARIYVRHRESECGRVWVELD